MMSVKLGAVRRNLQEAFPDIAEGWDTARNGVSASAVGVASRKTYWWRCPAGHEYQISVNTRIRTKGCKVCNAAGHGERVRLARLAGSGSLAEALPRLLQEWHPTKNGDLTPQTVSPGSNRRVWWRCSERHEWQTSPKARSRGTGCPKCYGERRGEIIQTSRLNKPGRSFADAHPLLLAEWD